MHTCRARTHRALCPNIAHGWPMLTLPLLQLLNQALQPVYTLRIHSFASKSLAIGLIAEICSVNCLLQQALHVTCWLHRHAVSQSGPSLRRAMLTNCRCSATCNLLDSRCPWRALHSASGWAAAERSVLEMWRCTNKWLSVSSAFLAPGCCGCIVALRAVGHLRRSR